MGRYDVIVIGMGPAGSMTARGLAGKGLRVLAIDKERFPRFKSCGGCVSIKVDAIADFDFSSEVIDTVNGIDFSYRSQRPLSVISARPIAYNVERPSFDEFLAKKAVEAGAEFMEGLRVNSVVDRGDRVEVETAESSYEASFVVGAGGASDVVGRNILGLDYRHCHLSITSEVDATPQEIESLRGRCLVDFGIIPHGYAWIFPKKDRYSIGIAGMRPELTSSVKDYFAQFCKTHPLLKDKEIGKTSGWTIPVYHDSQVVHKGRAMVAGDAAHMVDPFLGEGIYYAMRSGQLAAEAVVAAIEEGRPDLSRYDSLLEAELYPDFRACASLVKLIYGHPRLFYAALERQPGLMQKYYDVLTGQQSCEEFYKGLKRKVVKKPWKVLSKWLRPGASPTA